MTRNRTRRALVLALFLGAVTAFAGAVGWVGFRAGLEQLDERGRADLALASDRLQSQLQGFRELSVLLADHPVLVPMVLGSQGNAAADRLLIQIADKTGSLRLDLADRNGRIIAGSAGAGGSLAGQPHFERAMQGALGQARFAGDRRIYAYASPIFEPGGPARGAIAVRVDIGAIEGSWPSDPSPVFFSGEDGVVFVANRPELVLTSRNGGARAFPVHGTRTVGSHEIWTPDARYLPTRALHLTQEMPVVALRAELLLDTAPAQELALWQAAVAAALCLAFGALLYLAAERRRALDERLAVEARAKAVLETRVAERTAELSAANTSLRREVSDRQEAEARLKKAQADLIQAGKLSALGQMSAGISHELNQPLMAIRSFAENGALYLERGQPDKAERNLSKISELARRMGRIIKNLRAFARQENEAIRAVDLSAVVDAVLELTETRLRGAGVTVDWHSPAPVWVKGGEVRLQQVVMNLVTNAVDAMEGSEIKRLELAIARNDRVRLTVRDTGPGIAEPDRIFDPFYSTKEVAQDEGMGLGLSISYGLVQSFGGAIRGRNAPGGGAEFTVELDALQAEAAA